MKTLNSESWPRVCDACDYWSSDGERGGGGDALGFSPEGLELGHSAGRQSGRNND